jgi:secreted trypsin-like serine protease
MVFTDSKQWELIGITSYGKGCAEKHPGVYTRITAFITWIQQYLNSTLLEPSSHACSCECPRGSHPSTAYTTISSAFACVDACKAVLTNPCESSNTYACLGTSCAYSTSTGYSLTGNSPNVGVVTSSTSGRYDESFDDDTLHRTGTYNSTDGRKYIGDPREGKNTGHGIFIWPNGDQYVIRCS